MPYSRNADLPKTIRESLPGEAQTVFRTVVNSELDQGTAEESAFKQAWTAVKNGWEKTSAGNWVRKAEKPEVTVTSDVCKVSEELGLVFGYAMVCKIDGKDHFDVQGHHIPEDTMLKTLTKFMESNNVVAKDMHSGQQIGTYVFAFPMTTEIAKSLDITVKQTGALVAMKPASNEMLQKFKTGERKGFSIGGINPVFEDAPVETTDS